MPWRLHVILQEHMAVEGTGKTGLDLAICREIRTNRIARLARAGCLAGRYYVLEESALSHGVRKRGLCTQGGGIRLRIDTYWSKAVGYSPD